MTYCHIRIVFVLFHYRLVVDRVGCWYADMIAVSNARPWSFTAHSVYVPNLLGFAGIKEKINLFAYVSNCYLSIWKQSYLRMKIVLA